MSEDEVAALGPDRFGAHPRAEQPWEIPERELVVAARRDVERERAVDALVLKPAAGVGARQRTQQQPPRHEACLGVAFAGLDQRLNLIAKPVVIPACGETSWTVFTSPSSPPKASLM